MITPTSAPQLRGYQADAVAAIRTEYVRGIRSTLLVLATGLGKTVVFSEVARRAVERGNRVLVLAHREELIGQAVAKLTACGIECGVEMASHRARASAAVVVASVQTLRGDRLRTFDPATFALIIIDEAHHAVARSYRDVLDHFVSARVLGVSATCDRADGTPLADVFSSVAYRYELPQAIADGWLCPLVARRVVVDGVDLSSIATRAGDLDDRQLAAVLEQARAVQGVVTPLLALIGDRPTIAFAASVAHAYQLAAEINARAPHLAARVVHGAMPRDQRHAALAAYATGECQVIVNVDVLSEGFDAPHTACIALIRPTKSRARYVQRIGRGTRLHSSKQDCLVIDFTGNAGKHRLVGPGDALAGDGLPADVRAALEQLLACEDAGAQDIRCALGTARWDAEQSRIAAARAATVQWHAEHVDPFVGSDDAATDDVDTGALATADQLAELAEAGLAAPPPSLSHAHAALLIDRLTARGLAGWCSYKVARRIAPSGIDTRTLSAQRARQLLAKLREGGFRPWALDGEPEAQTPEARAFRQAQSERRRAEKRAKAERAKQRAVAAQNKSNTAMERAA